MSTVLVVDNDPAALARRSHQLQEQGHHVIGVGEPERAISLVEAGETPSVAVLDVSLPDMTGFELAAILHECAHAQKLPVVFLSEAITEPVTFTEDGVTAVYLNADAVHDALPDAVDRLLSTLHDVRVPERA